MSAATFVAINSANNSIAAANAARTREKYVSDCRFVMEHGGIDNTNTTSEKQAYAECVKTIYPPEHADVMAYKIIVAAFLISALIGAVVGYVRSDYDKWLDTGLGALGGIAVLVIGGTILGAIAFLFS